MKTPSALAFDSSSNAYVLDTGNSRVEKWIPASLVHESSGTGGTHGEQTIYYTAAANAEAAVCGERPEWAGLPCERRPASQPETSGVPNLPVTTVTYNVLDAPLTSTEVKWSWDRLVKAPGWQCRNVFDGSQGVKVTDVEASDPHVVVYHLEKPNGMFLKQLANVQCAVLVSHPDSVNAKGEWSTPIGTGPFKLNSWKHEQYIDLDRHAGRSLRIRPHSPQASDGRSV